jgi:hypothetical protein
MRQCKALSPNFFIFFNLFETRLQFFETFVLPHFDNCLSFCFYYSTEQRIRLVALYNSCLRRIRAVVLKSELEHIRDIDPMQYYWFINYQPSISDFLSSFTFRFQYVSKSMSAIVVQQINYSTHSYNLRGARRLCVTLTPRVYDDMNFMVFVQKNNTRFFIIEFPLNTNKQACTSLVYTK